MFHIVDDEQIILEILKEIIGSAGYKVLCFESGQHYIDYLNTTDYQTPTAILSDVNMPNMTGHEMALLVREQHALQKIVFITGKADSAHHQFTTKLQCYSLDKPFQPQRLINLLNALHACETASANGDKASYYRQCELAIEYGCPFHHAPHGNG